MKKISFLLFVTFFCTCTFATISIAQDKPLNAQQVTKLFNGRTMTATEAGTNRSIKIHASSAGGLSIAGEEAIGPQGQSRTWSVTEEGQFCYSKDLTIKSRRMTRTCGFIVPTGAGAYGMYSLSGSGKRARDTKRKIVGGKGSKHRWTFSNFK